MPDKANSLLYEFAYSAWFAYSDPAKRIRERSKEPTILAVLES